ncbi:MAG: DUF1559 domain-containing protein [Planctomycetaceae bacterium]
MKYDSPGSRLITVGVWAFLFVTIGTLSVRWIQAARIQAQRSQDANHLKQLGLALHNYHDSFDTFPPGGVFRDDETSQWGWTTSIMPYLDSAPFYHFVDGDYSWNHPVNRDLYLLRVPYYSISAVPAQTAEGFPVSYHPANPRVMYRNSSVTLNDMTAGTSHTWLLQTSLHEPRPWGDACNWQELPDTAKKRLQQNTDAVWPDLQILLADGSVRSFTESADEQIWSQLRESLTQVADEQRLQSPDHYKLDSPGTPVYRFESLNLREETETELYASIPIGPNSEQISARFRSSERITRRPTTGGSASHEELQKLSKAYPNIKVLNGYCDVTLEELIKLFPKLEYRNGQPVIR